MRSGKRCYNPELQENVILDNIYPSIILFYFCLAFNLYVHQTAVNCLFNPWVINMHIQLETHYLNLRNNYDALLKQNYLHLNMKHNLSLTLKKSYCLYWQHLQGS